MTADGLFQAWVNEHAATPDASERELLRRLTDFAREALPRSQVRWAGSQARGTGVVGSRIREPSATGQGRVPRATTEASGRPWAEALDARRATSFGPGLGGGGARRPPRSAAG